ncbi:MAG: transcriptional repressor NrdR [Clostridiales bacterium]|nr:transcriptional repressor NrdR [Clostridiales bacterium]
MKCIYCNGMESRVVDSRQTEDGTAIRRRRECEKCGRRFTTYEKVDIAPLMVIKKDQRRQCFDVNKIRSGLIKACEKRPVSLKQIEELARSVEMEAYNRFDSEITSQVIGEMVMDRLKKLDEVAYVRFASVHRQFRDIQTLMDELGKLLNESVTDSSMRSSENIHANT